MISSARQELLKSGTPEEWLLSLGRFLFSSAHAHLPCTHVIDAKVRCSLHSSDSEGTFGTPEAESPPGVEKILANLDNSNHTGEKDQVSGSPPSAASVQKQLLTAIYIYIF